MRFKVDNRHGDASINKVNSFSEALRQKNEREVVAIRL